MRPNSLKLGSRLTLDNEQPLPPVNHLAEEEEEDFYTRQSRLQLQARVALSQAKDLAHMEMEVRSAIILFSI